jgi:O-antigen ligase
VRRRLIPMQTARTTTVLPTSTPAARPGPAIVAQTSRLSGMNLWFTVYTLVVLVEYSGMSIHIPALGASKVPTLLAYGCFIAVASAAGGAAFTGFPQLRILLAFLVWSALSVLWAVVRSIVPVTTRFLGDYFTFTIATAFLLDTRKRIDRISLLVAGLIIVLALGNVDKLSGARLGSYWAPYFMGDGNDFAWGLLTLMVFPLNLVLGDRRLITRAIGLAAVAVGVNAVLGTQSRGAFLAMCAGTLYYLVFVSRRKALGFALVALLGAGVFFASPSGYGDRMGTIANYEEDDSARQRTVAWKAAFQMAQDFPLGVGAGNFSAAYGHFYIPADAHGFGAFRWMSAHSVYFRVLAEYGFGGLIMLLSLMFLCFRDNLASARQVDARPQVYDLPAWWPALLNISMSMYCVGALFLGGFNYPHLFLLAGLSMATTRAIAEDSRRADAAAAGGAPEAAAVPVSPRPRLRPVSREPRPSASGGGRFF